mgnify:CR=1 FL=1
MFDREHKNAVRPKRLIDTAQQRLKLWGRARIVENDLELMERLVDLARRRGAVPS